MKKIFYILFFMHLFFFFGKNVTSVLIGHYELYHSATLKEEQKEPVYIRFVRSVDTILNITNVYHEFTGTNTGYGFYAPQISSAITPMFDVYDGDKQIAAYEQISFPQKELILRVESLFDQHLEKIDEAYKGEELNCLNENPYYRFLDLRMHSLSRCLFRKYPMANRVKAKLYLFEFSPLYECTLLNVPYNTKFEKNYEYEYKIKA